MPQENTTLGETMPIIPVARSSAYRSIPEILAITLYDKLFPGQLRLVPQLNEVYELELAFYESQLLSEAEIIANGAYFAEVSGQPTRHFLMCHGEPLRLAQHSSSRLKSFFKSNQFKTGYGTHGLFPYRGKFHPQMIKGLINAMGLKPGDIVLDPMMGSGTVLIEASLMGINSLGVDASPFCEFMTKAKIAGLTIPLEAIGEAIRSFPKTLEHFNGLQQEVPHSPSQEQASLFCQDPLCHPTVRSQAATSANEDAYNYLLLAFLDAKGYAQRSNRKTFKEQFKAILERYYFVAEKIQQAINRLHIDLGSATAISGDARKLPVEDASIDGIIFSPPYSFAIDYLENDEYHLKSMGIDINSLRQGMIGLRGRNLKDKYSLYLSDMEMVISECSRVLKDGHICSIVVGTNNNQLSKILGVNPREVPGIDETLIEISKSKHLNCLKRIERQITGMANTMRTEYILMLQKNK